MSRRGVETLRAAWWAVVTVRRARRDLARRGLDGARVPPPPRLRAPAIGGVELVLDTLRCSCLERALVLQSWQAAHGAPADVVIGVAGPSEQFRAHAWLDTDPGDSIGPFVEIHRIPAARA